MDIRGMKTVCLRYIPLVIVVSLLGFSCAKKPSPGEVAVRINDFTLTVAEYNALFTELNRAKDTPQARKAFLENLITRKLLLQEAQKDGIDREKDFKKSVENFWEQSLLKQIVDRETKEISKNITVTEEEERNYYNLWTTKSPENTKTFEEMRALIKSQLIKAKQSLAVNSWIEGLRKGAKIDINKKAIGVE